MRLYAPGKGIVRTENPAAHWASRRSEQAQFYAGRDLLVSVEFTSDVLLHVCGKKIRYMVFRGNVLLRNVLAPR